LPRTEQLSRGAAGGVRNTPIAGDLRRFHSGHYNVAPGTPATTQRARRPMHRLRRSSPRRHFRVPATAIRWRQGYVRRRRTCRHSAELRAILAPSRRGMLQVSRRHAGVPADCRSAPDMRLQRLQLHHLPRPHGQIKEYSRKDLCLQCHTGAPTMAGTLHP